MSMFFQIFLILGLNVSSALADGGSVSAEAYRARLRDWVRSHGPEAVPAIAPAGNDRAADLVDELRFVNLSAIESAALLASKLEVSPWSGSYWPTYAGQIASRYNDPSYSPSVKWKNNKDYLESTLGRVQEPFLSPAEKYDILVGDKSFALTKAMIQAGAPYADRDGSVPTWFGLCHGWAPAAFMMPRPDLGVTARAVDGRDIYFTPSDLKALATLLWANGAGATRFVGGRCEEKEPARGRDGREKDPSCFDTNPATWHLAVVNQIGVARRSFVMDVSPGTEVWNQPVYGYRYAYINPLTGAESQKLSDAKVRLVDWKKDPFSATRGRGTEYVVKISMAVDYVSETSPSGAVEDFPSLDAHYVQTYLYDLELDRDDNIVGGEWHSQVHPDFLWTPAKGSSASSEGDAWLQGRSDSSTWSGREPLPLSWRSAAQISSAAEQPLAKVVFRLFEMVNEGR